ncbi:hypothetical protein Ddye_012972 [Dipteronia dyeriana]|uniref:Ubiquitin-like protease family profile domain-containing protein n=1 Tax=Dipteronia dyeriana TaxID=168575 RepID=A0AAD9X594_9ROSI|nr:hypothetical protein Ddye_012972 [Dipteronia dyeriana]
MLWMLIVLISDADICFRDYLWRNNGTKGGGLTNMTSDSEGFEPDAGGLRPSDSERYQTDPQRERHRYMHRQVRFTTPGHGTSTEDSRGGVGRDGEADLLNDVREAFRKSEEDRECQHLDLVDMIRKSDEDRQQQHRVLLDMIWGLQESTIRVMDVLTPVDAGWFMHMQSNFMDLEDTVLIPCNVGGQHWLVVTVDLILGKLDIFDPWRHEVLHYIRKQQVRPVRWFLPSMLNDMGFHTTRRGGRRPFPREDKPFSVSMVSTSTVPQQKKSGNCGPHTLRLIEYLLVGRSPFDWSEDDMGIIREKMVVEIFYNFRPA